MREKSKGYRKYLNVIEQSDKTIEGHRSHDQLATPENREDTLYLCINLLSHCLH